MTDINIETKSVIIERTRSRMFNLLTICIISDIAIVIGLIFYIRSIKNKPKIYRNYELRSNTPCVFTDGISEEELKEIAFNACKDIKRLSRISTNGSKVYGTMRSVKGISEWDFCLDFNDYGHITGNYWILYSNHDSVIPKSLGDRISASIVYTLIKNGKKSSSEPLGYTNDYMETNTSRRLKQEPIIGFLICFLVMIGFTVFWGKVEYDKYQLKEEQKKIEIGTSSQDIIGKEYKQLIAELENKGFTNVTVNEIEDLDFAEKDLENQVTNIEVNKDSVFNSDQRYRFDTKIVITYHTVKKITVARSSKDMLKMPQDELEGYLRDIGYFNIVKVKDYDLSFGFFHKDGEVEKVAFDGIDDFNEYASFRPDVTIVITYHTFKG